MEQERAELLPAPPVSSDWRIIVRVGFGIIFFSVFLLGGWAAMANIDSAVVAPGAISVESYRKTVQHLEGGIVAEILVREGQIVREGDVLIRLDPTKSEATDRVYRQQLAVALTLEARLSAQREMRDSLTFPEAVLSQKDDPLVALAMQDNERQFETRKVGLQRAIEIIEKQIGQTRQEIAQAAVDEKTATDQLASIAVELPNLRSLLQRGLVALPRVSALERQEMAVRGTLGNARLSIVKGNERIAEYESRIEQLRQDYRQEAANGLPDVRKTIGDVQQSLVIARDALRRVEVKAPVAGAVQQMRFFTIGGVIRPGDPILDIVPAADTLVVRARIWPSDRDRIREGLPAEIRFPQLTQYQLAPIKGVLRSVSQDSLIDETSPNRQTYFAAEVAVERDSIPAKFVDKLTAGMTVDVIIPTEERTVLTFLLGPMLHQLTMAMRER